MRALFSAALFLSAALLFWIQLLVGKLVLPVLGGSAAVWNTNLVFFQSALLAGYLYADLAARRLRPGLQAPLHLALLALAGLALPVALGASEPPTEGSPVPWLLGTLLRSVGAPFVVLAASAPLLQNWFSRSGARGAADPYFLYAASNLGSLLSLLSYPTWIEPRLRVVEQGQLWALGYAALLGLTALCALASRPWRAVEPGPEVAPAAGTALGDGAPLGRFARLRWVALAFVPSSLLLGVTNYLTLDVAAAPLFWVVPLALYLASFVLAFQRGVRIPIAWTVASQTFLLIPLAFLMLWNERDQPGLVFPVHLAAFFATALLCHQRLAAARPPVGRLTEYYLWVSFGGALGGAFNALVAPVVFDRVLEYPLVLVAACLLRPASPASDRDARAADVGLPLGLLALLLVLPLLEKADFSQLEDNATLVVVALGSIAAAAFRRRRLRFALGIAAILFAGLFLPDAGAPLLRVRNFYGTLAVRDESAPPVRILEHGTTAHGEQSRDPARRLQPLSYYHPDGPLGRLFAAVGGTRLTQRVAAIGLGAGTVACYARPGEAWTFFEINAAVVRVARDSGLFSFLSECPTRPTIVLGDARRSLAREPDGSFGMILLDAFSSDAIPVHLITREAIELYLAKLAPGGLVVFHISNRFLDLNPVLANATRALGLAARGWSDDESIEGSAEDTDEKDASDWVVVARSPADLAALDGDARWKALDGDPRVGVWSDDYANLLGVLRVGLGD